MSDYISRQPEQRTLTEDDYAYCTECDHVEMCRWYPMYGCEFKSRPSAQPDVTDTNVGDTIYRQDAINLLKKWSDGYAYIETETESAIKDFQHLPSAQPDLQECEKCIFKPFKQFQPEPQWIPIKWHDCTDKDREKYGFSNDIVAVFDCEMPDDDQPILVTTSHGYVNQDVCYIDDGYSLDSGWDWIDDIKAWMPLPEPYNPT